ncbi:hypothetical protein Tco_0730265 [Tanacetum coccineum]|uniref:Retrovirus-related Pol polyprotein from transposon TNT 1-94-like beta-barrel domain-containing protein n=2 Tax=Tanacetum coccineum TaxID=301880 RepID=A0ABQ4YRA7_9ASTR
MAALKYKDDHNKIAYLGRERGCEDFTDILSYLDHSPLRYALTHAPPVVFDSLVKQFWATAVVRPNAAGSHDLVATIDGREVVVTESLIRTQLQFDDANGIFDMPINDILEGMRVIGYPTDGTLTFLKIHLSPQWRFLGQPIPLTTPMLAIAAAGNDAAGGDDAANEDNVAANEAAGSAAEAHLVPHSPPVSPVREPTPERQPVSERPPSPSPTIPETEWVVPNPVSPVTDWRPWPYVPVHSPIRDPTPEPVSPPTPPAQTFIFEEPLSPVRSDDAPTPTADAAGREEDPALLTGLSAKLDRCMGPKEWRQWLNMLRKHVGVDASSAEGDDGIFQYDIDLDGLSRMASTALGHDQPVVPSEDVEEREEEKFFLTQHPVPAGPSVAADKGKVPMPDLDIPAEFLAEDAQARKRFEEEQASERLVQRLRAEDLAQEDLPNVSEERAKELDDLMMRMTETDWLNLMMQVGSNPALARELLGADVNEENFIERMNAVKEKKKRALADLRYRALQGYEDICRRLEKDRLLSAQYNLFRPKPAITEPPSKRQRVEPTPMAGSAASNTAGGTFGATVTDSTVSTTAAMDSAGSRRQIGVSPFAYSAADLSPFLSSIAGGSSPSNVSTDQIPIAFLVESTSGGINEFFLESDEEEQIGMSRVVADPDSDDEVIAEIIFRGKSISGDGVVFVDKLPDDDILDPRVKVETVSESASSPPRSRRKHLGVRSDDFPWDKPVEDFFSSESESDDDMENYIPPLPYGKFKDWEIVLSAGYFRLNPEVDVGLELWRDVNMLCQSLHPDDVEDFWRTQDEWIVSSWKMYPKSSVHVLDLTKGRLACTARQMVFSSPWLTAKKESDIPLQTALVCFSNELMVARVLQNWMVSFSMLPKTGWYSFPCSYWDEKMASPRGVGYPEQTATGKDMSNPLYGCDGLPKTVRIYPKVTLDFTVHENWTGYHKSTYAAAKTGRCCSFDVATSFDSAVHRVYAVSIDAADLDVASTVSAACIVAAGYIVSAGIYDVASSFVLAVFIYICCLRCFCCYSILLLREDLSRNLELTESKPSLGEDRGLFSKATSKRLGKDAKEIQLFIPLSSLDKHVMYKVKARFGGNEESKKMRKTMLKQQFTEFSVTEEEGLHKGYDRFQKILSQLNQNGPIIYSVKVAAAPTHSAFIGAASSASSYYSDHKNCFPSVSQDIWLRVDNIMECLGHFARECNVKTVDDKARYSAFKVTEVKTDEPKALVSVDSMVNWSDHAAENKTGESLAMIGISPKVQNCPLGCDSKINDLNNMYNNLDRLYNDCYIKAQAYQNVVKTLESQKDWHKKKRKMGKIKYEETLARFEKWKESSKNLNKLVNSSMSTRTKIGLGFKEYFGEDEVFDLYRPSTMYPEPVEQEVNPLYSSDKSSDSATYASCDSSLKTKTKDFPPAVGITTLPESDVEDPNSTTGSPSFSCSENVKSPRIICNKSGMNNRNVCKNNSVRVKKCFVCGSKLHLIKDCDFYNCVDSVPCKSKAASVPAGSRNLSASVTADGSDPAASRNRPAVNSAGRPKPTERVGHPAGWSKRPAPVSAGRPVSAGWLNPAARPYFRPSYVHFNNMYWPNVYDPMIKGRWGTAGDPSTDNDIGIVDSGCSRSMTGNKEKLDDFVQVKGGIVKFGGGDGRISGKGTIKTSKLDFENVYYVEELQHFNLFSVSQICDKKNKVLFTDTDCLVLTEEIPITRLKSGEDKPNDIQSTSAYEPAGSTSAGSDPAGGNPAGSFQPAGSYEPADWVSAIARRGCNSIINQKVWKLVPLPHGKNAIGTKWILKNKRDARGIIQIDMESVRTATTPYEAAKTKLKDEPDPPVNVHLYRSMIGSLMYLTASRPDIMFAVSACSRHQVTPLTSHLNAVKKIFKYLKGQPKLGLWYPKDSPFQLEAYSDSDYAGSHGDRKSTTGGCQFLGRRLISWQCKKQTIVATSSTEAEYVAAASCCAQVVNTAASSMDSADGSVWLTLSDAEYIMLAGVLHAVNTSIYAAELVCAGSIMFLLSPLSFCCAQFDIAGWLVSATSHFVSAGGRSSNEDNAAANEAVGSATEAHLVPHSPVVSPVREPTPERQPVSERPPSPSPTIPETEWVVPNPVSPVTDWRPWP